MTAGIEGVPAAAALRAMKALPIRPLSEILQGGGLLVIAPHQDDESLACGGLIAEACARGVEVRVLFVSDGTGSHPRSRSFPRIRLRNLREAEARDAVIALGLAPRQLEFLRLPDRYVPREGATARAAVDRIVDAVSRVNAKAIFVSWRHDPHCDHQAAYALAREAQKKSGVSLYEYSVWGAALKASARVTPVRYGFRLWMERHRARKRRAIDAHRSQTTALITDDPSGFRLSKAELARFSKPYESFVGETS